MSLPAIELGADDRFRGILEQLPVVVYVDRLDELSSAVYVSHGIEELTGYPQEAFERDSGLFLALVHADDRERYLRMIDERNRTGTPASGEYRLVARDGRTVWVYDQERIVRDETGRPLYAQGYLVDTTARRSDRVRLEAINVVLTTFSEGADLDEVIRQALETVAGSLPGIRASYLELRADGRLHVLAATPHPTLPDNTGHASDPADAPDFLAALERGEPVEVADTSAETRFEAVVDAVRALGVAAFLDVPLLAGGRLAGVVCLDSATARSFDDGEVLTLREVVRQLGVVFERDRAARDLQRRDDILSSVSSAAAALLAGTSWEDAAPGLLESLGEAAGTSRAYIFEAGTRADGTAVASQRFEWCAGSVSAEIDNPQLQDMAFADVGLAELARTLARGEVFAGDVRAFPQAARELLEPQGILSIMTVPIVVDGAFWGFVGFDECEREREWSAAETDALRAAASLLAAAVARERLEAQLMQSQRLESMGRLAGGVAHDFNNLLTAISGYTSLLLERAAADPELTADLREVQRAAERAADLTRQLLAFGRRQVLRPSALDLNEVVTGVESMLRRLIGEDVALATSLDRSLGNVLADPGQIEQVVVNLAVNARDAMPQGGTLRISTHATDRDGRPAVALEVADTGSGMDDDTRARIFEPFFTTREQGVGLGLATVYGIVAQSEGTIEVSSEPGRGSTFTVVLPRHDSPTAVVRPRPTVEPARGSETILLVEDEDVVRALTRRVLEQHGYTVLESRNGHEALGIAETYASEIALMLTDVVMPGLRGHELADRVAASRPDMRVVYMSGYADEALLGRAADGDSLFLEKPFSNVALAEKIRSALA